MLPPRDLYLRMRKELIKQSEDYMKTIVEYDEDEGEQIPLFEMDMKVFSQWLNIYPFIRT